MITITITGEQANLLISLLTADLNENIALNSHLDHQYNLSENHRIVDMPEDQMLETISRTGKNIKIQKAILDELLRCL